MFGCSRSTSSQSGYHCLFFGGRATPLKAPLHQALTAPLAGMAGKPPLLPMPPPMPLLAYPRDTYTPAVSVLGSTEVS